MRKFQNIIALLHLSIIYFIWCTTRYMIRWTHVPCKVTRSTKLRGAQQSPELGLRSTDFRAPENLICPALVNFPLIRKTFPESRFSNPWLQVFSTFKGTRKNHDFVSVAENIVMNCVSEVASKNLLIQHKDSVLSIEYIMPGLFCTCSYDDEWYFAVANYVSVENCDVNIKFLHPNGPFAKFFGPVVRTLAGLQYMISLQK